MLLSKKTANLKELHTVWFQQDDILEKTKICKLPKDQHFLGIEGRER